MNTIKLNTIGTPKASGGNSGGGGNTPSNPSGNSIYNPYDFSMIEDGNTHFFVRLYDEHSLDFYFRFRQSIARGVRIDWGDGSDIEEFDALSITTLTHTYSKTGLYNVSISPIGDCKIIFGGTSAQTVLYSFGSTIKQSSNITKLVGIEFGKGVQINDYAFRNTKLEKITFSYPPELVGATHVFTEAQVTILPILPSDVVNFITGARLVKIVEGVKHIPNTISNATLTSVYFPKSVEKINDYAFQETKSVLIFDFSDHEFVPELLGTNALKTGYAASFGGGKIVVPDNLYDEWINATNWSDKASFITKKSEWDALNA